MHHKLPKIKTPSPPPVKLIGCSRDNQTLAFYETKIHNRVHNSSKPVTALGYSTPVHKLQSFFLITHFNIILLSTRNSSKWSVPFSFMTNLNAYLITSMRATNPTHFYILVSVHLGIILINNQLAQFHFCIFISILYTFRATLCSSSGKRKFPTYITDGHLHRVTYTRCCIHTMTLLMMSTKLLETCR